MFESLPLILLFKFLMVIIFGFLTGLELREYLYSKKKPFVMGTTRTFTFIALVGFVLNTISESAFLLGFAALSLLLVIFYAKKIQEHQKGILQILVALLTYSYGAIVEISIYFIPLVYVSIVFTISSKSKIQILIEKMDTSELITFSKFLIVAVIILPLLPDTNVIPYVSVSPFKIWIAVVVVSSISYISYILQKYFLANAGIIVTSILGGIYSSTATTVVLAKKALNNLVEASIVLATGIMYLRLLVIIAIFNLPLAKELLLPFVSLFTMSFMIFLLLKEKTNSSDSTFESNPLELEVAFIFAALFIVMAAVTEFVTNHYGNMGLQLLSGVVGFTDIDPFILSLVQGKYNVSNANLIQAILIAVASNNILKAIYAGVFSKWKMKKAIANLVLLSLLSLAWIFLLEFL